MQQGKESLWTNSTETIEHLYAKENMNLGYYFTSYT